MGEKFLIIQFFISFWREGVVFTPEIDTMLKRHEKLNYEKKFFPIIKPIKNDEFTLEF